MSTFTTTTNTKDGYVTASEIRDRYPNVIDHVQASLSFTEPEAVAAVQGHVSDYGGGASAVLATGGGTTCLRIALRSWRRDLNRRRGAV